MPRRSWCRTGCRAALSSLPQAVQAQGVTVQKRSTAILLFVTLTSPDDRYDSLYLANYATINLKDELARLPGVGNVNVFGAGQYSMRIWLDPEKLKARSLNAQDVVLALQQQSQEVTAGQVGMPPTPPGVDFQYTIDLAGRLTDVDQFENVIVKTGDNGEITRLRDVGRVELGAQTYSQAFTLDGKQAAGIGIYQSPGANALDVEHAVKAKMTELARTFPQGLVYSHPVRHDDLRQRVDPRSLQDADRSGRAGADRHPGLPPGLARHAGAGDHGAGDDHRRIRRDVGARLHREFLDACSRSCCRSASWSTTPSSWSKAPRTISKTA